MRTTGKITHWNAEKGYGFITPSAGAKQVFVHINAFANRSLTPTLNELVTFTLSTDRQGRPCAVEVTRAGETPRRSLPQNRHRSVRRNGSRNRSPIGKAAMLFVVVAVGGAYAYSKYQESSQDLFVPLSSPREAAPPKFHCDGRTYCSQMTSCEEAYFFLKHCARTQMDGDGDRIPCERQWCG